MYRCIFHHNHFYVICAKSYRIQRKSISILGVLSRSEDNDPVEVMSRHVRPRARHKLRVADVEVGSRVMVNYNYDEPGTRGYWYDALVTGKHVKRSVKQLTATVFIG